MGWWSVLVKCLRGTDHSHPNYARRTNTVELTGARRPGTPTAGECRDCPEGHCFQQHLLANIAPESRHQLPLVRVRAQLSNRAVEDALGPAEVIAY